MSSPPFDATIDLAPRPSARALALLFWLHAAVLVLAMLALGSGVPLAGFAAATAASWVWIRRHPVFGYGSRALLGDELDEEPLRRLRARLRLGRGGA